MCRPLHVPTCYRLAVLLADCSTLPAHCMQSSALQLTDCWRRGVVVSGVRRMNEVNPRRARLVLGWATVFVRLYHLGM